MAQKCRIIGFKIFLNHISACCITESLKPMIYFCDLFELFWSIISYHKKLSMYYSDLLIIVWLLKTLNRIKLTLLWTVIGFYHSTHNSRTTKNHNPRPQLNYKRNSIWLLLDHLRSNPELLQNYSRALENYSKTPLNHSRMCSRIIWKN